MVDLEVPGGSLVVWTSRYAPFFGSEELAIARSYARAQGGDLLYEDAAPHGARFLLVLPAQQRQPEATAASSTT
jgi:hypothetical protein